MIFVKTLITQYMKSPWIEAQIVEYVLPFDSNILYPVSF